MFVGYARVSTMEQNINLQLDALSEAGCEKIFEDKGALKRLAIMDNINISLLSEDFIDKVDGFEWLPEEKVEFLREMIGLTNKERESILNEMIKYRDSNDE